MLVSISKLLTFINLDYSPKIRLLWREQTSRAMPSYSPTRWWSRWELFNQIMVQFGDVEPLLCRNEDIAPATKAKLLSFFTDNERKSKLKMELAVVIDYGENFVKATYDLEGDGPLIFRIIDTLCIAIKRLEGRSPNAEAVANRGVSTPGPTRACALVNS